MVTLITVEHVNSKPFARVMPLAAAYGIAKNGYFHKAQIVNEYGVIDYEFNAE